CSLIIPMICASVKRLFRIRLLLQKVEQTLHQNEGSFGEQVIRNDGSVVDLVNYVSAPSQVSFVDVGGIKKIWTTSRYNNWIGLFDIPDAEFITGPYLWGFQHGGGVTWFGQRFADTNEHLVAGANNGLVLFNKDEKLTNLQGASTANRWQQMSAVIASEYASGWLPGDVKSALLANTDATSLAASGELVTNGGFDTDADWAKGTGWTISGGVAFCDGAQTATTALSQTKVLSPGTYVIEFDITAQTSGSIYIYLGATIVPSVGAIGHYVYTFTVTSTTTTLYINGSSTFVGSVDNISIQRADPDRSVHNRSLIVNGTLTRTPVADGAELVGYSGFSATGDPATSNFLEQPYNSALDFGIGPFSMIWWEKKTIAATRYQFDRRGSGNSGKFTTYSDASGFLSFLAYDNNGTIIAGGTKVATVPATINAWVMQSVVRDVNGTLRLFTNGKLNGEYAFSGDITNVLADAPLVVGNRWDHMNAWGGALALLRISVTAPTADQIAKIYEHERKLFQPGAQCTLYGTSDAVMALAHDPKTDLLHVGTSAGRSTFDGLLRVANTETPVTTAISAVNGLIAEQ
ncbi:LamG-like jellyroll fold domain-containing protein, partial [Actibacterium sp. D379-3]